jgi:branched-chain amino acid transport system ATP-binding protein
MESMTVGTEVPPVAAVAPPIVRAESVTKRFEGVTALVDVTFTAIDGKVTGLIGPNGSGKTTLINIMSRHDTCDTGRIFLGDLDVSTIARSKLAGLGLGRTYQKVRLFRSLTVLENVMVGQYVRDRGTFLRAVFRPRLEGRRQGEVREEARRLLSMLGLSDRERELPGSLPYGLQRLVEIARALALGPKVLMLDEPAAGLNADEKVLLGRLIRRLRDDGLAIVLVEHDMSLLMSVCDDVTVLNAGRVIARGTPDVVQRDPSVIATYLGDVGVLGQIPAGSVS